MEQQRIEGAIEAVLFCAGAPVKAERLCEVLDTDEKTLSQAILYMNDRYEERGSGLTILTLGDSLQMATRREYADMVRETLHNRRKMSLSRAALEVLSIVAYHQPVTRAYIEQVRGVECSAVVATLCEKELIYESGKLDAPGRPNLYNTTPEFLRCFGLKDLCELPELPQVEDENGEREPRLNV